MKRRVPELGRDGGYGPGRGSFRKKVPEVGKIQGVFSSTQRHLKLEKPLRKMAHMIKKKGSTRVSVQFSPVTQSCPTLGNPIDCSTPALPVHRQIPQPTQTHVHRVSDATQPSHPLLSPSAPAFNPSQHQGLFQRVGSSHQVAKVLEFQFQHLSFQ